MDLISRQDAIKAIEELQDCYNGFSDSYDKACIIGVLEEIPAAPVREVKRGRWIDNKNRTWSCSLCHSWIPDEQHYYANYCLHCGAEMENSE